MASGQSQDHAQDRIDLHISQTGNTFSASDLQKIDTILEAYIVDNSDNFHKLIENNPQTSLDDIIDNAWLLLDDMLVSPDKGEKEIWQFLIDSKLAWLEKHTEMLANITQYKSELKWLKIAVAQRNLGGNAPSDKTSVVKATTNTVSGDEEQSRGKSIDQSCVGCKIPVLEHEVSDTEDMQHPAVDVVPGKQWERLEDRAWPDNTVSKIPFGPLKWYVPGQWYYVDNKGEDGGENTRYDIDGKNEKKVDRKAMKKLFLWGISWFLNRPEKEVDMVVEGEKIGPKHKNELKQFWKAARKMGVDNFGEYFIDVRDAYGAGHDITSKDFWKDADYTSKVGKRKEAKTLALIGTIYMNYRDLKNKPYSGTYMERLIGTIENDIADNAREDNADAEDNTSSQSFDASKSYNKHNDNAEVTLADDHHILINKTNKLNESLNIDERKWVKELFKLNGDRDTLYDFDAVMKVVRQHEHKKIDVANVINATAKWKKLIGPNGSLNDQEKELYETRQQIDNDDTSTQRMVMEWLAMGMRPEYIANVKMLIDKTGYIDENEVFHENWLDHEQYGNEADGGIITPEVHFVGCIEDIAVNGKTDFGDKGIMSGLQFRALFQTAVNEIAFDRWCSHHEAQQRAVYNIVCFVSQKALELWHYDLHSHLQAVLSKAVDGKLDATWLVKSGDGFLSLHPGYLKWFHDIMLQSPVPVDAIMKYGTTGFVENQKETKYAFEKYAEQLNVTKEDLAKINNFSSKQWESLMSERAERSMTDIVIGEREAVIQQINAAILDYIVQTRSAGWVGVGVSASLDTILKGLSAHLALGVVWWDGSGSSPMLWFSLGHHTRLWWEGSSWSLNTWAWSSLTLAGFTPFLGQSISKERELNKDKLKKTLDAKPLVTAHVGVNYGVVMFGPIVSPTIGIHTGIDINHQAGIEREYAAIRTKMKSVTDKLFKIDWLLPDLRTINSSAVLFAKKQAAVDTIEKILQKTFSDSKHDMHQAAENLYKWMLYFDCAAQWTQDKMHAADMLAEYYAVQRKNLAIEKTRGGFSWFDLGIDYIVAISTPVLSASISFEKYYTATYADSRESLRDIENAKNYGRGNRLKSKTIGQEEVDFLNYQLTTYARKTAGAEPTISLEKRDGVDLIKIPDAFYAHNRSEICIDPSLKWCIMHDEKSHCFYIPKSTIVRLGSFAAGQNTGYTLNLGDNKTEADDMRLQAWRSLDPSWLALSEEVFLANAKEYAKRAGETRIISASNITQTFTNLRTDAYASFPILEADGNVTNGHINVKVENGFIYKPVPVNGMISLPTTGTVTVSEKMINGQREFHFITTPGTWSLMIRYATERLDPTKTLLTTNTINQNSDMRALYNNSQFPLAIASSINGGNVSFDLKNANTAITPYSPVTVANGVLSLPLGHKLVLEYDPSNNSYSAQALPMIGNKQSLAINFVDGNSSHQEINCEITNILDSYQNSYIDSIRKTAFSDAHVIGLSELEDLADNRKLYYQFMEILNASVKSSITQVDIDNAVWLLTQILTNGLKNTSSAVASQSLLDTIKTLSSGGDYDRKTYIVNKMKQIFSLEDKAYIGQTINSLTIKRSAVYDALARKESFGGNFTASWYQKNFADIMKTNFAKWKYMPHANVIGFTSYYRNSGNAIQNKWFSLSWLGDVNIYWNSAQSALKILDGNEKTLAKTWFINKLEKNTHEFAMAKQSYYDKIKQVDWLWGFAFDDTTFKKLLMWESVVINGREISVKANMIAYLQGECCNQWIGMQIESVCYDDNDAIITEDGHISEVSQEVVGDTRGGRLYVSTPYTRGVAMRERKEIVLGVNLAPRSLPADDQREWPWPTDPGWQPDYGSWPSDPGGGRWEGNGWGQFDDQVNG